MTTLHLIPIDRLGNPAEPIADLPAFVDEIGAAYRQLYSTEGFEPPWTGSFTVLEEQFVGGCGYKSPPRNGRVEIAYFTLPQFQGRGYATAMAERLIGIAESADPKVVVFAQTLPQESASTSILKRLNFELLGTVEHPEDGLVWEWQRRPG